MEALRMRSDARLRMQAVLDLLEEGPLPVSLLAQRVSQRLRQAGLPPMRQRAVEQALAVIKTRFGPGVLLRATARQLRLAGVALPPGNHRVFYHIALGSGLIQVRHDVVAITALEAIALRTAREVLSRPAARSGKRHVSRGPLADALDRLATRLGVRQDETGLPDVISIPPSQAQDVDADVLATVITALRMRRGLRIRYQRRDGEVSERHINPLRLVIAYEEPYVWAWEGEPYPKNFKVARMGSAVISEPLPAQPTKLLDQVQARVDRSFEATAGDQMDHVEMLIAPDLMPSLRGRRFGLGQQERRMANGWFRIHFRTAGAEALLSWVLGCGPGIEIIAPVDLRQRIAQAAMALFRSHRVAINGTNHRKTRDI
jgi:predicted DNA-binding transcriptional regulator YafY